MPTSSATQAHQQTAAAPLAGLQQHMQQHGAINSQLQLVLGSCMLAIADGACSSVLALAAGGLRHPTPCHSTPPTLSSRANMATCSTRLALLMAASVGHSSREPPLGVRSAVQSSSMACSVLMHCDHDELTPPTSGSHKLLQTTDAQQLRHTHAMKFDLNAPR